jgi:DNA-binding PadR family transcriptional regulator
MAGVSNDEHDELRADDELPATAYAVLGILSVNEEELTAGEIKTRATFGMRHFYWSPALSHIRRELRRLLSMGMAEEREITNGRAQRSLVYQTTAAGEEALNRWLAGSGPDEPVMVKNAVLLRAYLGAHAPIDVTVATLDARIAQVEEAIEEFHWGQRRAKELDLLERKHLRFALAVGEYTLRSLYFESANLRQLRERIVGFDTEAFRQDASRRRGPTRRRRSEN